MSSPAPAPPPLLPPPVAVTLEQEATDDDMDEDEVSEDDDDNQWEESSEEELQEDDDNVVDEEQYVDWVSVDVAAVVEEHGVEIEGWPTCCICMEPRTSDGDHRICCLPCGHVYGRSCLEKWFHRCGNTSAKCPQCGRRFGHKHITNLHVSGNVWDDYCRLQSMIQELEARLAVNNKKIEQLSVDVGSKEKNQQLKAQMAVFEQLLVEIRSEVAEEQAKLRAELETRIEEAHANLGAKMESQFESIQQSCWEEAAQDAAAVVQAELLSIKEQMRKMADQENATPVELLRFMDQNGAKLWQAIRSRPPAAMSASTGTMED